MVITCIYAQREVNTGVGGKGVRREWRDTGDLIGVKLKWGGTKSRRREMGKA